MNPCPADMNANHLGTSEFQFLSVKSALSAVAFSTLDLPLFVGDDNRYSF